MQLARITWRMARSQVKRCRDLSGGNVSLLKDLTEARKVGIKFGRRMNEKHQVRF